MLLALLIGFGKRRHELVALDNAAAHRRNAELCTTGQCSTSLWRVTAAGTLIAYAVYTLTASPRRITIA